MKALSHESLQAFLSFLAHVCYLDLHPVAELREKCFTVFPCQAELSDIRYANTSYDFTQHL
jgi:hypothetical protein